MDYMNNFCRWLQDAVLSLLPRLVYEYVIVVVGLSLIKLFALFRSLGKTGKEHKRMAKRALNQVNTVFTTLTHGGLRSVTLLSTIFSFLSYIRVCTIGSCLFPLKTHKVV